MKKLFHLMIAGVLVLSVTGCGKSETSRTRNSLNPLDRNTEGLTRFHEGAAQDHLAGGINTPRKLIVGGNPIRTVDSAAVTPRATLRANPATNRPITVISKDNRPTTLTSKDKLPGFTASPTYEALKPQKTALTITPPPTLPPPRLPPRNYGTSNTVPAVDRSTKPAVGPTKKSGTTMSKSIAKGLKGLGKAGLASMATNALALIPPIPGMPPALATILGFGGAEDTSLLDAIAAIEAHLVRIDEKLAEISDQVSSVQEGVNTALGLLNYIITQNKCSTLDAKYAQLSDLTLVINEQWKILYGDSANAGLQTQIIQRMVDKYGNNDLDTFAFTSSDSSQLAEVKRVLIEFKIDLAVQKLGQILLSSGSSPGLLASVQACTTKRFLSSSDSDANAAVVLGFQVLLEKAATLQAWSKVYGITPLPTAALNDVLLKFSNINGKLAALGLLRIPAGQVLDTATNKMWAHGKDNVRLVQAMNGCPDTDVQNIAERMQFTGEFTGTLVQEVLKCVSSTAIDMPMTDSTDWRLPAIYEISQQDTTKVNWQGSGGFPKAGDALFKGWSADVCGVSRTSKCESPSQYLIDNGASWLVNPETKLTDVVGTGKYDAHTANGLIWSSTSMAAASGSLPYPRATASNNIVLENDKSLTMLRSFGGFNTTCLGCGGNDWGFNKQHIAKYQTGNAVPDKYYNDQHTATCNSLYGENEQRVGGGTYRGNCWAWGSNQICANISSSSLPRGTKFTYGDTPFPHTFASVRTADLTATQGKEQVHAIAMANTWGASMDCTNTKDTSNFWDGCCQYTQTSQSVSFPEYARTLYVRDLKPDEFYTFGDRLSSGNLREVALLAAITPPEINVVAVGGEFNVLSIGASGARCSLDPATPPTSFATFQTLDPTCSVGSAQRSLKPGWHTIYAMAESALGLDTGLVIEEVFFEGTPPPKAEFTATAKINSIEAKLTTARNPDYEYEATAFDGTTKRTCRITVTACTITELANNFLYGVTIKTSWGNQESVSNEKPATPFGPPPAFECTNDAEDEKVTLNCTSDPEELPSQTPVDKYVVKNGSNASVDCTVEDIESISTRVCVIVGLTNGVDANLEVVARNAFGETSKPITARPIGVPDTPTGVVASGSEGKIYVSWNRESTGYAATKYVATATSGAVQYSCISAQTMVAGIITSPAPTECVITVPLPKENSNLSYKVTVKGGNGKCSESSTTCKYSTSAPSTPSTISPQFDPDRPTLVAEVIDSKVTVTATAGTRDSGTTDKIIIVSSPIGLSCDASSTNQWKCVFDKPTRGQIYTFTGTGYNSASKPGATGTSNAVTVYATPTKPVISQTTTFDRKILVTMGSSADVIDSYTVTANPGGRTCLISRPNQSCEVTGLTNGMAYSVSAKANNNGGISPPSEPVPGLEPFGVPSQGSAPTVELDTQGGSAVFHLSLLPPKGVDIESYEVRMVNVDKSCTIVAPGTTCDIPIANSNIGFVYQFKYTATNRIGESLPSLPSDPIKYEKAPLAPQDVILTTHYGDIIVEVLPAADGSIATKFAVTGSPGNYSCTRPANSKCVFRDAARGKVYFITMKAINASGTSPASSRLYYLTAPPEAPEELTTSASSAGLVVELGAGKIPTDTDSMLVTATPSLGGAPLSCKIILPAKTCVIESDPTKTYKISAAGEATSGEVSSTSKSFKPTGVVKTIAAATQNLVAPAAPLGSSSKRTTVPQINKTINLGKKSTSKIKIDTIYSAFIKSLPLSAGKASLLKFTGKVNSDSKKICKTKGSDVILLKKGVCNISAKFKVIENKKSKTVELSAKITVG